MGTVTGANTWWSSWVAPDDGLFRSASNVLVSIKALADRSQYLYERVVNAYGSLNVGNLHVNGTTQLDGVVNALTAISTPTISADTHKLPNPGALFWRNFFLSGVSGPSWSVHLTEAGGIPDALFVRASFALSWRIWPMLLPGGSTITGVAARVSAPAGSALPGTASNRYAIAVFRRERSPYLNQQFNQVGSVTYDSSGVVGDYQSAHVLSKTLTHVVDLDNFDYWIGVRADVNGNVDVHDVNYQFRATGIRPGGA